MKKTLIPVVIALALLAISASVSLALDVIVNGKALPADPPAVEQNHVVMLPVRAVFPALNAEVTWDQANQTITAVRRGTTVKMKIGNATATVNDKQVTMDQPPATIRELAYVPARFVAEAFGAKVEWNADTRTMTITLAETAGPAAGGGAPAGAPTVLAPQEGDKVGTRVDVSIKTTPGVLQVIWTVVKDAGTGEVLRTVPGIRHLPNDDGTYQGGIATPRISFGEKQVPVKYDLHFRNGPNDGDPETVVHVVPNN